MKPCIVVTLLRGCSLLAAAAMASIAIAQSSVTQDGRLLDRNPALGGGGVNQFRYEQPLLSGNAYASGEASRGLSLRSYSPISSGTAFRAGLGSGLLGDFRRDSISIGDTASPLGGLSGRLYYDTSRSVFTVRRLGVDAPANPGVSNPVGWTSGSRYRPIGAGPAPSGEPLDWRVATLGERGTLEGQITGSPRGASGALPQTSGATAILDPRDRVTPLEALTPRTLHSTPPIVEPRRIDSRPIDVAELIATRTAPLGQPLDVFGPTSGNSLLRARADRLETGAGLPEQSPGSSRILPAAGGAGILTARPVEPTPSMGSGILSGTRIEAGRPTAIAPDLLPGRDLFSDLQLANSLALNPNAGWFSQMKEEARRSPTMSAALGEIALMDGKQFADKVLNAPIATFVGNAQSDLNDRLANAENLLRIGRFYDADREYERARLADPLNPLPLVGKGNALLAAGDYAGAARNLLLGMERYPELGRVTLDLSQLMGGGESIDIRRSEILQRLKTRDDASLRFLLGYLEYHSGRKESGLKHLERAAELSEPNSFLRKLPNIIQGKGPLPTPKLPPSPVEGFSALPRPGADTGKP